MTKYAIRCEFVNISCADGVATVYTSPEGVIEVASPPVRDLLGWHPEDMVGRPVFEFLHPDDLPAGREAHQALNEGRAVSFSARMKHVEGGHVEVMASITPIVGAVGLVVGRLGTLRSLDVALHTTGGVITWVSSAVESLTGWHRDQLIGTPSWTWVHEDDRHLLGQLRRERHSDRPGSATFRMLCRDGSARWFEVLSRPLLTADGAEAAVSVMRDVHARVSSERAQEAMRRRFAATLDQMFDPHSYLRPIRDESGRVVDLEFEQVNDALCRYLRRERGDLEGHRVSELLPRHLERGIVARAREVLESGTPFVAEGLRSWNDMLGDSRLYDITVIPVDGIVSMWHRDVTERYQQFHDAARLQSMTALQSERERLARDLHDGAIQKVFATSLRLAALASQLPEPARGRLEELIDLQDAVIRDLRATVYELGTTGRSSASPLRAIRDTVSEASRALGFVPDVTVDDGITLLDAMTLGHMLLVLREALSNVARHAHAGRVEVTVRVIGSEVLMDIWDDGVGVAEGAHRGDGLANIERRAALLGGVSSLVSEVGRGSELVWRVPLHAG